MSTRAVPRRVPAIFDAGDAQRSSRIRRVVDGCQRTLPAGGAQWQQVIPCVGKGGCTMLRSFRFVAAIAAAALPAALASGASLTAVEYYHAGFDHYFVTAAPREIAALDSGKISGWSRTGEAFGVLDLGTPGAASVCRFWSGQTWAPKSSHFYTPFATECATVKGWPEWRFEGEVFAMHLSDANGNCAAGTVPLYRLFNRMKGGAPNHRYTTSATTRAQMIGQGWIAEGRGIGVIGCVTAEPPATVSAVVTADIGQCFDKPAAQSGAAQTAALVTPQDAIVLTAGDNVYDYGTVAEYANCFQPTWGAHKDRMYPTIGNHDYYTTNADGYFGYFGAQAGPDRLGYYSFDYAGWHIVSLNSIVGVSTESEQYRWLVADLAKPRDTACTLALMHFPLFNSGLTYGSVFEMRTIFQALYDAGVELVISGHDHLYERFAPQRADGTADPVRGVRQFVVGTGGHTLNPFGTPLPNSEFRYNATWGVLRLKLGVGSYSWQFVPVGGGAPIDAGAATCHQ
jgi:hypothetical protein